MLSRRSLTVLTATTFLSALLVALPAFGQGNVQYDAVCQNIIGSFGAVQVQVGAAKAVATGDSAGREGGDGGDAEAVAEVAQEAGVSVAQVNECLNRAGAGGGKEGGQEPAARAAATQQYQADVIKSSIPKKLLPFTGGIPLLGLFAVIGLLAAVAGVLVLRAVMSRRL